MSALNRRGFLRGALATSALLMATRSRGLAAALSPQRHFAPRRDGIVLGGTFDHGDWSLAPNPEQTTGILEMHAEVMKGLKG